MTGAQIEMPFERPTPLACVVGLQRRVMWPVAEAQAGAPAGARFLTDYQGGRHRLILWRRWGDGEHVHWLMLNPSTADASANDATLDRITQHTKRWGYDGLTVTNLYSFCATKPADMWAWDRDGGHITQPETDDWTERAANAAALTICAWGANGDLGRAEDVLHHVPRPHSLGCQSGPLLTADGHPVHPLTRRHRTATCTPVSWTPDSNPTSSTPPSTPAPTRTART